MPSVSIRNWETIVTFKITGATTDTLTVEVVTGKFSARYKTSSSGSYFHIPSLTKKVIQVPLNSYKVGYLYLASSNLIFTEISMTVSNPTPNIAYPVLLP